MVTIAIRCRIDLRTRRALSFADQQNNQGFSERLFDWLRSHLLGPGSGSKCANMPSVLANRTYRHLLSAQIVALVGTGLATVALGLLAYDIAGGNAGAVLALQLHF